MYLAANLDAENVKPMTTGRGSTSLTTGCPYNIEGKCSVYEHRFSGCRIFSCKGDTDFQSRLSERALKKFKSLCTDLQIPYRYTDLATAATLRSLREWFFSRLIFVNRLGDIVLWVSQIDVFYPA